MRASLVLVLISIAVHVAAEPDPLTEKLRHCPPTVDSARTTIADVAEGVELTVVADTAERVAEVRRRVKHLEDFSQKGLKGTAVPHGGGAGGGFMRNCPVVTKQTLVSGTDVPNGSKILVRPIDPAGIAELRADTRRRYDLMPKPFAEVLAESGQIDKDTRLYAGAAADLAGDGKQMLIVGGFGDSGAGRIARVAAYVQKDKTLVLAHQLALEGKQTSIRNLLVVDLDGDKRQEIVVLGRSGRDAFLRVFGLRGAALVAIAAASWRDGSETHGFGLDIADLDGDRSPEIVTGGFQIDGGRELGQIKVWKLKGKKLSTVAASTVAAAGFESVRINAITIGDLDGDGTPEIVSAGRSGAAKKEGQKPEARREQGLLTAWSLKSGSLVERGRFAWVKGTTLRLRAAKAVDLDADKRAEVIAAGQFDADGKPCLAVFKLDGTGFKLTSDADWGKALQQGEVKDVIVHQQYGAPRIVTTGPINVKPYRQGQVQSWTFTEGKLALDASKVSTNGEETLVRALVVWGKELITVGYASRNKATLGQLLAWGRAL